MFKFRHFLYMKRFYKLNHLPLFLFLCFLLIACSGEKKVSPGGDSENQSDISIDRDLKKIKEDGVLTILTLYNSTSYFLYRGKTMGFEYEMVERLAKSLDLELRIKVADKFEDLFTMLNSGKGDMIAFGLSITQKRKNKVAFTNYHYLTHQVLVQRMPKNWRRLPGYKIKRHLVSDPIELIGDTVHIRKNTSYYERIQNLEQEIGGKIYIQPVDGNKTTDDIINMVVDGEIDYTVADYNLASVNKTYHPILDIGTEISFSQRIAWAVRKNSPELLNAVNQWIETSKKKDFYYVLYNKYFKNKRRYRRQIVSKFYSKNEGRISPYDQLIRDNSKALKWDWRLVSSLIYQESRFDRHNKSWAGAGGLMQIMPATAKELGLKNISDPGDNIRAGTIYLHKMFKRFDKVRDSTQRIKFAMASYNCGYGHVRDAQRLAEAFGKDPLRWDGNVEEYILKLAKREYFTNPNVRYGFVRGAEPYNYVRDIFRRYEHYRKLIPFEAEENAAKDKNVATR
jgi:membrane-bound lytic murein transglycosylase F